MLVAQAAIVQHKKFALFRYFQEGLWESIIFVMVYIIEIRQGTLVPGI